MQQPRQKDVALTRSEDAPLLGRLAHAFAENKDELLELRPQRIVTSHHAVRKAAEKFWHGLPRRLDACRCRFGGINTLAEPSAQI